MIKHIPLGIIRKKSKKRDNRLDNFPLKRQNHASCGYVAQPVRARHS